MVISNMSFLSKNGDGNPFFNINSPSSLMLPPYNEKSNLFSVIGKRFNIWLLFSELFPIIVPGIFIINNL